MTCIAAQSAFQAVIRTGWSSQPDLQPLSASKVVSPFTNELSRDELLGLLGDCAERAERLRKGGADVVFVTGAELSLFTRCFFPGETCMDRLNGLLNPGPELRETLMSMRRSMNEFLPHAAVARERFEEARSHTPPFHRRVSTGHRSTLPGWLLSDHRDRRPIPWWHPESGCPSQAGGHPSRWPSWSADARPTAVRAAKVRAAE
jgi:hypothetical protein